MGNAHLVVNARKNRRFHIIAAVKAIGPACAAGNKLCTFIDPDLDQALYLVIMCLADHGAIMRALLHRVAKLRGLRNACCNRDCFVVDRLFN